jgi:hypothetical protein
MTKTNFYVWNEILKIKKYKKAQRYREFEFPSNPSIYNILKVVFLYQIHTWRVDIHLNAIISSAGVSSEIILKLMITSKTLYSH